jgi:cation transport ATPase
MRQSIPGPFTRDTPVDETGQRETESWEREGTLHLGDLRCHACARRAEVALQRLSGVRAAAIGLLRDRVRVRYDARCTSEQELAAGLRRAGYQAGTASGPAPKRPWVRLGISVVAFANLVVIARLSGQSEDRSVGLVRLALSAVVLLVSGLPLLRQALARRLDGRDLLACGSAIAAFGLGLFELAAAPSALPSIPELFGEAWSAAPLFGFESAAGIVLLTCLTHHAAAVLRRAAHACLAAREEARTIAARRLDEGDAPQIVPSAALRAGDRVRLFEGEQAPADLRLDGPARVALRGGRGLLMSSHKRAGEVIGEGAVLLSHEVNGRVVRGQVDLPSAMDAAVHRSIARIDAGAAQARLFSWSSIARRTVLVSALSFAAFALLLHSWLADSSSSFPLSLSPGALLAAIAVLVSASTAAFSLAAPAARAIAVLRARAAGIVVKDVRALEVLADADIACFDPTSAAPLEGAPTAGCVPWQSPSIHAAVRALWRRGLGGRLLSGDPPELSSQVARRLGIPCSSGLSSAAKARVIAELRRGGARVLLVSAGAPRIAGAAAADVTVAIAPGTPPDAVGAPIVASGADLDRLPALLDLARALRRRLRENTALTVIYNALVIPAAALGWLSPLQAASLLLLETMLVLSNAARLLGVPVAAVAPGRMTDPDVERRRDASAEGGADPNPRALAAVQTLRVGT